MSFLYTSMDSPVGSIYMAAHEDLLCAITMGKNAKEKLFQQLNTGDAQVKLQMLEEPFTETIKQLNEYFSEERTEFDIPLILNGSDFQKLVWQELLKIPYGQTISYGDLANRLDKPGGMRAVGSANGQNPIPIIVPCHRVIAADGSLGGYSGGLDIKHKLLDLESQKFTPTLF